MSHLESKTEVKFGNIDLVVTSTEVAVGTIGMAKLPKERV